MNNKILLINPNRYRTPPVIPVGLEYIASALHENGYNVRVLDLCFEDDPIPAIRNATHEFAPSFAGVTIRNIDTALFNNNIFLLPGIIEVIAAIKECGIPVVLGGIGFSGAPEHILNESGADYGIAGPGMTAIKQLAEAFSSGVTPQSRIINGWDAGIDPKFTPRRPFGIDYDKYLGKGGLIGFATQYGCTEACDYCIEAGKPTFFRDANSVVRELDILNKQGYSDFHLCDSEFNLDLSFSEHFAESLADSGLNIKWALYIKPTPWSEKMFVELNRSGATTITMSVDSFALTAERPRYAFSDLSSIIDICRRLDIKLAVDLLTGHPGEPIESTAVSFDFLKIHRPDAVGVNTYFRLYPGTKLKKTLDTQKTKCLMHTAPDSGSALAPVFYNHFTIEMLQDIIGGDDLFKIEGFERTSNYERLKNQNRDYYET
jgi:hypothetical protein